MPSGGSVQEDYSYLCLNCGAISPHATWTFLKYDDEGFLVASKPGDMDPICRCPVCAWDHTDDDSNPGIYDGTRDELLVIQRRIADEYLDHWRDVNNGIPA